LADKLQDVPAARNSSSIGLRAIAASLMSWASLRAPSSRERVPVDRRPAE